jgi:hypothetical protein
VALKKLRHYNKRQSESFTISFQHVVIASDSAGSDLKRRASDPTARDQNNQNLGDRLIKDNDAD